MRRRVSVAALILAALGPPTAVADQPPAWAPFEACSANEQYCAYVEPTGSGSGPPSERKHVLRVVERNGPAVWSSPYFYDGYAGGFLSNDGAYFVTVNFWYEASDPVVSIYSQGRTRSLPGNAFSISETDLVRTVSHRVWLDREPEPVRFIDAERMSISTIDGRVHTIHLPTAHLSSN